MKHSYYVAVLAIALNGCGYPTDNQTPAASAGAVASTATTPTPTPSFQGVYQGTSSNGKTIEALILEDNSWWDIYGVPSAPGGSPVGTSLIVQGVATGTYTDNSGNFTIAFNDFYTPGTSAVSGTGSGTNNGGIILGTTSEGTVNNTFSLIAAYTTSYNYDTAASISSIAGIWTGGLLDGESATINITANGSFTGSSSLGCSVTGTASPRASGKNVFNVSLTFGAAPCASPNQTVSGIAITYLLGDGTNQLVVGLVNSTKTTATAFFATR
jgi:hypothetical protein